MRKTICFLYLFLLAVFVNPGRAFGEDTKTLLGDFLKDAKVSVSGTTAYFSKYIWRGLRLDGDGVIQPGLTISAFDGWSFSVWSSFDVENEDSLNSDEIDSTLNYAHTFEDLKVFGAALSPVTVTLGHTYYDFPGTDTFSRETMISVGYGSFLSPAFSWYHDYGNESQGGGKGDYYVLALGHSIEVLPSYGITVDLSGHAAYNDNLFISGVGGDILLTAGLTIPLTKKMKMQPSISWSSPSGDVRHESAGNQKDELFGGATFFCDF